MSWPECWPRVPGLPIPERDPQAAQLRSESTRASHETLLCGPREGPGATASRRKGCENEGAETEPTDPPRVSYLILPKPRVILPLLCV